MLVPDFNFEKSLIPKHTRYLLGIDEVGRGPWAGPVAVGAFLIDLHNFDPQFFLKNKVRDSKTLSNLQRQKIKKLFDQNNYSYKVFLSGSSKIDQYGISNVINSLVRSALKDFRGRFDFALLDGNLHVGADPCVCPNNIRSLTRADSKCFSVASASIVAKVVRDQKMIDFDQVYPGYNFSAHKGYGTPAHQQALEKIGICKIHRQSYKPIKKFI